MSIADYYNRGREEARLSRDTGQLEMARTQEIVLRYLPKAPATIMDIGGGAGVYSFWLADLGYQLHLVDLMPIHIEQAKAAGKALASATVGDARKLDFPDASADAVLLLGPLYHLTERSERLEALREAYRILKPSGYAFVATISRYASFIDGLLRGFIADDYFAELMAQDLRDGQHRNPKGLAGYFSTAFFHHPDEIQAEVNEAGFQQEACLVIEGMAGSMPNFEAVWADEKLRERLLANLRTMESEPSLLGATGHLMTIGRKV